MAVKELIPAMLRAVLSLWRDETGSVRAGTAVLIALLAVVTVMWCDRIGGANGFHIGLHHLRASVRNMAWWLP